MGLKQKPRRNWWQKGDIIKGYWTTEVKEAFDKSDYKVSPAFYYLLRLHWIPTKNFMTLKSNQPVPTPLNQINLMHIPERLEKSPEITWKELIRSV